MIHNITESLKHMNVIRDGKTSRIHVNNLVVGDIVILQSGMEVGADGVLLEGDQLVVDESQISDECYLMKKMTVQKCKEYIRKSKSKYSTYCYESFSPMVFAKTYVVQGEGKMLVLAVGKST